jgi:hypothetical protein
MFFISMRFITCLGVYGAFSARADSVLTSQHNVIIKNKNKIEHRLTALHYEDWLVFYAF